jgi:hypothetical protein
MKIENIVEFWSAIVLSEISATQFFEEVLSYDTVILWVGLQVHFYFIMRAVLI